MQLLSLKFLTFSAVTYEHQHHEFFSFWKLCSLSLRENILSPSPCTSSCLPSLLYIQFIIIYLPFFWCDRLAGSSNKAVATKPGLTRYFHNKPYNFNMVKFTLGARVGKHKCRTTAERWQSTNQISGMACLRSIWAWIHPVMQDQKHMHSTCIAHATFSFDMFWSRWEAQQYFTTESTSWIRTGDVSTQHKQQGLQRIFRFSCADLCRRRAFFPLFPDKVLFGSRLQSQRPLWDLLVTSARHKRKQLQRWSPGELKQHD